VLAAGGGGCGHLLVSEHADAVVAARLVTVMAGRRRRLTASTDPTTHTRTLVPLHVRIVLQRSQRTQASH